MIKTETNLKDYLKKKWKIIFPTFKNPVFEYPIMGAYSQRTIGIADIVFDKGKKLYVVEIKYEDFGSYNNFWEATKVIAYAKAIELYSTRIIKPTIMVAKNLLSINKLAVLGRLGLSYISIKQNKKGLFFEYFL